MHSHNIAICIKTIEKADFRLNCGRCEVTLSVDEVAVGSGFGSIARLHWIDEAGLFVVAEIRDGGDVERCHHILQVWSAEESKTPVGSSTYVVFVDEIVTVELHN